MRFRNGVRMALRALFAHRVRGILALSSVAVGVAAVALTSAIGAGAQREVIRGIETMGTNLLVIRPAQVRNLVERKTLRGSVTTLTIEDSEAIAGLPLVAAAAPGAERGGARVKAGTSVTITKILGTTPAWLTVRRFTVREGRFFDSDDDRASRRVAVLGARSATALFDDGIAVGSEIRIRGIPFEVIGVLESKGVLADGSDEDNQVLVPIRTALRRVFNSASLNAVFVSVRDLGRMEEAGNDIATVMRGRHRRDDFAVQNTTRFVAMQKQTADLLTMLATALAALALLVAGIGILALMLMSVRERTAEIGLRIAVGATPRDILEQFLFEATLLALSGWVAGLAIGALGATVVVLGTEWALAVPGRALLASVVMILVAGVGFGALPARKASRMHPIEALLTR